MLYKEDEVNYNLMWFFVRRSFPYLRRRFAGYSGILFLNRCGEMVVL